MTQNVASCFISSQKNPQRCINKCRHIKVKWNENTFAPQHDTTCASNLGIIAAACHTMSLSTQGKEALRNVHGDLACVSVCACEAGTVTQFSSHPHQFTVDCARGLVLLKTRYCHQVMELTHVSLSLTGFSRFILVPCPGPVVKGIRRCFWDLKRESSDQVSFQSCKWALLCLLGERRPLRVFIGVQFDYIYHRKQLKPKYNT